MVLSIISVAGFWVYYITILIFGVRAGLSGTEAAVAELLSMMLIMICFLIVIALITTVRGFLSTICLYKIFESTVPKRAVVYIVLYLLFPFIGAICLLASAKKGYPYPEVVAPEPIVVPTYVEEVKEEVAVEPVVEETVAEEVTEE